MSRILNVQQSVLLARIKQVVADHRYGGTQDEMARAILEVVLEPIPTPARDIRECVICGDMVTVSNATERWEAMHRHERMSAHAE